MTHRIAAARRTGQLDRSVWISATAGRRLGCGPTCAPTRPWPSRPAAIALTVLRALTISLTVRMDALHRVPYRRTSRVSIESILKPASVSRPMRIRQARSL
jgi:hypothetical protein